MDDETWSAGSDFLTVRDGDLVVGFQVMHSTAGTIALRWEAKLDGVRLGVSRNCAYLLLLDLEEKWEKKSNTEEVRRGIAEDVQQRLWKLSQKGELHRMLKRWPKRALGG